jgi:hypothetical protein
METNTLSEITITLNSFEVLVLAGCIAAAPAGPEIVEDCINSIARKINDALDLASIPTI